MRIPYCFLVLVSFILSFFSAKSQTWQPLGPDDFNQPSFRSVKGTRIVVDASNRPYIAYRDDYNSNKAFVKKFNGSTWEFLGVTGVSTGSVTNLCIVMYGGNTLYIAYSDLNANTPTIKKFDGSSWVNVATTTGISTGSFPYSIALDGNGNLYIAYSDVANSYRLTVQKFDGSSWSTIGSAPVTSGSAFGPSLAIDGNNNPYVAYSSGSVLTVQKFDGSAWVDLGTAGSSSYASNVEKFSIAIDPSGTPCIAYSDYNTGKIHVKKYDGATWLNEGTAGFSAGVASDVGIKIDGAGNQYVCYIDNGSSPNMKVKKFDGANWIDVGSGNSNGSYFSMGLDASGNPFITYSQQIFNGKAVVKKFNGSTWENITSQGIGDVAVFTPQMVTNSGGVPYVLYENYDNFKAEIRKYEGGNWVSVGQPNFSASYTSIAMDANDMPYVMFRNNNKACVKKYDGSAWVDVGTPGFSAGDFANNSIKIGSGGDIYVAYRDAANGTKATVKKFDGTNWVDVGPAGFTVSYASYLSFALDANGTPYVAYCDGSGSKATVKKYDGSSWVDVGTTVSPGTATYTSIAIDASGTPYVCYLDGTNNNDAEIKKFNGTSWVSVGAFTEYDNIISLTLDANGTPYISYGKTSPTPGASVSLGVKKFNGTSWVDVGTPGIAAAPSTYTSLAFGYNNAPIVSYFNGGVFARSFGNLVILPLRLTAFNGHINNNDALLTWKTDDEINTREFIIERSTDGRYYSTAGSVQAANSTGAHQYTFTDRNVDQLGVSVIYYRLKLVDIDGQTTYSRVLLLSVDKSVNRVICYPNPVTSEANLTITLNKAEPVQARIIDNMGKIVQVQQWNLGAGSTLLSLNMSELANGLYYIGIKSRSLNKQVPVLKQ